MNFGDIITEVGILIADSSSKVVSRIPGAINEAVLFAAEKVDIPSLKSLINVSTVVDQAWASLPSSSAGKITHVSSSSSNGDKIQILPNLEDLLEHSPSLDFIGSVDMVAQEGMTLYYQSIPTTVQRLLVVHYAFPDVLREEGDIPIDFPSSLHRGLFVHGALSNLYEIIEDGLEEEEKTNTLWHKNLRDEAINGLFAWRAKNRRGRTRHPYNV